MLTFCSIQMHISSPQEVFHFSAIRIVMIPSHKGHHKQTKIMFRITKFTLSDRIYPIECGYIRIEGIMSP